MQNDRELKSIGLPDPTLRAMSQDATPLAAFQSYNFDDYAQLAKRYGVKNDLFPRVLKWIKKLGKSLSMPSGASFGSGVVFAREEEHNRSLSEAELAQALEEDGKQQ